MPARRPLRTNDINFDVTPDGQRFLLVEPSDLVGTQPLMVVTDWVAGDEGDREVTGFGIIGPSWESDDESAHTALRVGGGRGLSSGRRFRLAGLRPRRADQGARW